MKEWAGVACIQEIKDPVTGQITEVPTIKCFEAIFSQILTIAVSLAALALFVMLVVGGFRYLTSAGDQKAAGQARATFTYALVGILLLAIAFIVFILIREFTGVDVLKFEIPTSP